MFKLISTTSIKLNEYKMPDYVYTNMMDKFNSLKQVSLFDFSK